MLHGEDGLALVEALRAEGNPVPVLVSKYPPAKPGALKIGPLKAARPSLTRLVFVGRSEERREETLTRLRYWAA